MNDTTTTPTEPAPTTPTLARIRLRDVHVTGTLLEADVHRATAARAANTPSIAAFGSSI